MEYSSSLDGRWLAAFDPDDQGLGRGWASFPPASARHCPVPSCWNIVIPGRRTYDGTAWFYKTLYSPEGWEGSRVQVLFEAVNYRAEAYLNGEPVGSHEGGFTPFHIDLTGRLRRGEENLLSLKINGEHGADTIPAAGVDWFNYNGIHRPVWLKVASGVLIDDYRIRGSPEGTVVVDLEAGCWEGRTGKSRRTPTGRAEIRDASGRPVARGDIPLTSAGEGGSWKGSVRIRLPEPIPWELRNPYLYELVLTVEAGEDHQEVRKQFGLRTIATEGCRILLNGKEVRLVGCSKHEDYPGSGRTLDRQGLVHEYEVYSGTEANVVRLCHYPHNGREHEVLNELGIGAIAEFPLVFLHEEQMNSPAFLEKAKRIVSETIAREKNETCILFWSLFIECDTDRPSARPFVEELVRFVRNLDPTRLLVTASIKPLTDLNYDLFDVVGVNYWEGWYRGQSLEEGREWFRELSRRYPGKPLLVTSHGWEGLLGCRAPGEDLYWSEDLQAEYLESFSELLIDFRNAAGEIVWTFSDFRVSRWEDGAHPTLHRKRYLERPEELNHKGLVDYHRRKKLAYETMRRCFLEWRELASLLSDGSEPAASTPEQAARAAVFRSIDKAIVDRNAAGSAVVGIPVCADPAAADAVLESNLPFLEALGISAPGIHSEKSRSMHLSTQKCRNMYT